MPEDPNNNTLETIIEEIQREIADNKCILLTGCCLTAQAYIDNDSQDPKSRRHPPYLWRDVLKGIIRECKPQLPHSRQILEDLNNSTDKNLLMNAASEIEQWLYKNARQQQILKKVFLCYEARVGAAHYFIAQTDFRAYFNTNYDMFIEDAYQLVRGLRLPRFYETDGNIGEFEKYPRFILKLNGDVENANSIHISDHAFEQRQKSSFWEELGQFLEQSSILAIGFEKSETDLCDLLQKLDIPTSGLGNKYWMVVPSEKQQPYPFKVGRLKESEDITLIQYRKDATHSELTNFLDNLSKPWQKKYHLLQEPEKETIATFNSGVAKKVTIFLYSSENEEDKKLRKEFANHLAGLSSSGSIDVRHEDTIDFGKDKQQQIKSYVAEANIILPLLSSDYLNSNDCQGIEQEALQRTDVTIIPILLRSLELVDHPFSVLRQLPSNHKAVTSWEKPDEAFENICKELEPIINKMQRLERSDVNVIRNEDERSQGA